MNRMQSQLHEFHTTFEHKIGEDVGLLDDQTLALRCNLIEEEYAEFVEAHKNGDLTGAIDGLMDLLYVTIGTCVSMGVDIEPFFNEVHRSNMSKVWPDGKLHKREDGKTIKPDTYSPADIAGLLHAMQNANRHRPDEEAAGVRQSVMDEVA
jgi:predicted HAD superfamily Cof-like phosphohydrolase